MLNGKDLVRKNLDQRKRAMQLEHAVLQEFGIIFVSHMVNPTDEERDRHVQAAYSHAVKEAFKGGIIAGVAGYAATRVFYSSKCKE